MSNIIEGYWDCHSCGTKGIKGRYQECPHCGAARDGDTVFYLKEETTISDEVASGVSQNPDWFCSFCESLNSDDAIYCTNCGSSKVNSELNYFQLQDKQKLKKSNRVRHKLKNKANVIGILIVICMGMFYINLARAIVRDTKPATATKQTIATTTKQTTATTTNSTQAVAKTVTTKQPQELTVLITGINWKIGTNIQRANYVKDSGWSLPTDARLEYTKEEIADYEKVIAGYDTKTRIVHEKVKVGTETYKKGKPKDMGNGYFKQETGVRDVTKDETKQETYKEKIYKDVPIYKTKYYYSIARWQNLRTEYVEGNTKEVNWGKVKLEADEREGDKKQYYNIYGTIMVNGQSEEVRYELDYADWLKVNVGETVHIRIDSLGKTEIIE
jgi:hypothetical protein